MKGAVSMEGWFGVKTAAKHAGVSTRTLRMWIDEYGLKYSRVRGRILIKAEYLDDFLEAFTEDRKRVDEIVDQVLTGV